jgi:hypothetical protein
MWCTAKWHTQTDFRSGIRRPHVSVR